MHWKPERDANEERQHSRLQPGAEVKPRAQWAASFTEERTPAAQWPQARLKGVPRELACAWSGLLGPAGRPLCFPSRLPRRMNTVLLRGLPYSTQRMQSPRKRI